MRALRASPHALLRNEWAPPFACLSPPLSGQPLNRGACYSRQISRSTPCVDGVPPDPAPLPVPCAMVTP